jgi:hypothetical protein
MDILTFRPRSVVGRPPGIDTLALAPGTVARAFWPPERREGGVTVVGVEALVHGGEHGHTCAAPGVRRWGRNCEEMFTSGSRFYPSTNSDKLSGLIWV